MWKRLFLVMAYVAAVAALTAVIWMNRFYYPPAGQGRIRVNRFTQKVCYMYGYYWRCYEDTTR